MPNRIDITGKRFGKLIVLEYSNTISGVAKWKCKCDCGNIIITSSQNLRYGDTTSCGCYHKEKISSDLTGFRFGKLTVIKRIYNKNIKRSTSRWECKCDCGNIKTIRRDGLTSGSTTSCGCFVKEKLHERFIDITGKIFDNWTVLKYNGTNKYGDSRWLCKCVCGNKKIVSGSNLRSGKSKGCGKHIESFYGDIVPINKYNKVGYTLEKTAIQNVYSTYKTGAKRRKFIFDISKEHFIKIINQPCHYCGRINTNKSKMRGNRIFYYTGIDRIDTNDGYTINNIVPCCIACNRAKGNMSLKEFEEWRMHFVKYTINKLIDEIM